MSNTKTKEGKNIMKNLLIIILILIISVQYVRYNELKNEHINLLQAIEENIL